MKVRATLHNSMGEPLDSIEAEATVRDGQFSLGAITWKMAPWEVQAGDRIVIELPDAEG